MHGHDDTVCPYTVVCPDNATRLISSDDLSSAETNTTNDAGALDNILTVIPFQQVVYWGSTDIPNQGNLTFSNTFVITQFITSGANVIVPFTNTYTSDYVSEFSFAYSDSINDTDDYELYSQVSHHIKQL